ncbi:MAG: TlpA disulfide reductase family protein [Thermogemmata sp.]|nr:TlpA disulfide reductase family protein [Thermogemmata sp.]
MRQWIGCWAFCLLVGVLGHEVIRELGCHAEVSGTVRANTEGFAEGPAPPPASKPAGNMVMAWRRGLEAVYQGEVHEEVQRPGQQFRRRHGLEVRVVALGGQGNWIDLAVVTRLFRQEEGSIRLAAGLLADSTARDETRPLVRLDWLRLYADGEIRQLFPEGPPPLRFQRDTPQGLPPLPPLDSFAVSEWGMFPPPLPSGQREWTRTPVGRPKEHWQLLPTQVLRGERCLVACMRQEGEHQAEIWRRQDLLWVSAQDNIVRRVERRIERTSGRQALPWAWVETHYELSTLLPVAGHRWQRLQRDLEVAYCALRDAELLAPLAAQCGSRPFEQRLSRVEACLADGDAADPYRSLLLAAQRALEAARRGERPTTGQQHLAAGTPRWPETGQPAPDLDLGQYRLHSLRGRPVVLVFVPAEGETTELTLAIVHALQRRYAPQVVILPLVVWGEGHQAQRLLQRRGWQLPLYDGRTAAQRYAVTTAPRFLVLDRDAVVRWSFTGVGAETGFLLKEQLERLLSETRTLDSPPIPATPGDRINPERDTPAEHSHLLQLSSPRVKFSHRIQPATSCLERLSCLHDATAAVDMVSSISIIGAFLSSPDHVAFDR